MNDRLIAEAAKKLVELADQTDAQAQEEGECESDEWHGLNAQTAQAFENLRSIVHDAQKGGG